MKSTVKLNFMERYAVAYLQSRVEREKPHVHRWSPAELSEIRQIERWKIALAALTGATSGAIIGGAEIAFRGWLVGDVESADWWPMLTYWSVFMGLTLVISGVEILFPSLYETCFAGRGIYPEHFAMGNDASKSHPARVVRER